MLSRVRYNGNIEMNVSWVLNPDRLSIDTFSTHKLDSRSELLCMLLVVQLLLLIIQGVSGRN